MNLTDCFLLSFSDSFLHAFFYSSLCSFPVYWNILAVSSCHDLASFSNLLILHILEIYSDLQTEPPSSLPLPINVESMELTNYSDENFQGSLLLFSNRWTEMFCTLILQHIKLVCYFLSQISSQSWWTNLQTSVCCCGCVCSLFSGSQKGALQKCFCTLFIYDTAGSCMVSFHLVPFFLLVRFVNIRDQAEVETSKFPDSYWMVWDRFPPATFTSCPLT